MLIVAGLKAHASILLISCSGNKLASMLGSREPALRLLEDKGQSIVFLHLSQSLAPKQRNQTMAGLKPCLIIIFLAQINGIKVCSACLG